MNRSLVWTLAGAAVALLVVETLLLIRPIPRTPPPPAGIADSLAALERRADAIDDAYERLEAELQRYIQRAPPPARGLATETIIDELNRLGDEIADIQQVIVRTPERALAVPSMMLDIEKLEKRLGEVEAYRDRLRAEIDRHFRWMMYLLIGNGILTLAIVVRLGRSGAAPVGPPGRPEHPQGGAGRSRAHN